MCLTPFRIMHKRDNCSIPVPCGKCPECKTRRVNGWIFRLEQEYNRATTAHFVTITYDTTHVPITDALYMSLKKEDVQKFLKRLRKNVSDEWKRREGERDGALAWFIEEPRIKYYLCGEYGTDTNRPHYHAIFFNVPDWTYIEAAWQKGLIHYGTEVGPAAMAYTTKYMDKPKRIPMHRNDDRQPEFSLMSKGLGENYLTPENIQWHKADLTGRAYIPTQGKKISMPRYYKDKIYHTYEKMALAAHQAKEADKRLDKQQQHFKGEYFQNKFTSDQEKFKKQIQSQQKRNKI